MREYQFADRISNLKPSLIREILKGQDPSVIPLSAGNPAAESFPAKEMQLLANEIFENDAPLALQYSITEVSGVSRDCKKADKAQEKHRKRF